MTAEEVIRTMIQYRGSRQGLFTDYGELFDRYLDRVRSELRHCSLFESHDRPNTLAIRYQYVRPVGVDLYTVYHTDGEGKVCGEVYHFSKNETAAEKYLELYREDHPRYRVKYDKETGRVTAERE